MGFSQWNSLSSGTSKWLYSVCFTDTSNGYTVGEGGIILKTINGGTTWSAIESGTTLDLSSIYFTDSVTGYVSGGYWNEGIILKTINAGTTWTKSLTNTPVLSSVHFTTFNKGYVVGDTGTILRTVDGGSTWNSLSSGTNSPLHSIYFINATVGYVCLLYTSPSPRD